MNMSLFLKNRQKDKTIDVGFVNADDGHLCVVLEKTAQWQDYPQYRDTWVHRLGADIISEANSVDERICEVLIEERRFRITSDDFQSSIQLEPCDGNEDEYLRARADRMTYMANRR